MSSPLKQNTTNLQDLLNKINELPEAGADLPELTNEGSASDLLSGKQLIDSDGTVVTGTMPIKTADDLTTQGAEVIVPAGYYEFSASKSIPNGSAAVPNTTIIAYPEVSVNSEGVITATVKNTQSINPTIVAGYISEGAAGIVTVEGTDISQLPVQEAKVITPSTLSQTAVESGKYTTGKIIVDPIPADYIETSDATATQENIFAGATAYVKGEKVTGNFTIQDEIEAQQALIASIEEELKKKQAASILQDKTVTPSLEEQIISADEGYDALNTVIIEGDNNLLAENIKSGVSIFGVSGAYEGSGSGSGDSSLEDELIEGGFSTYTNDRVKTIRGYALCDCSSLTSVSFPVCTNIGNYAFADCSSLTSVSFPKCTNIDYDAFIRCSSLTSVSFPVCTNIGNNAFASCYRLSQVYLTNSSVCTLSNSNAFTSTPYTGYKNHFAGTPYIYVPTSLVASYKSATNWVYFSSYISGYGG